MRRLAKPDSVGAPGWVAADIEAEAAFEESDGEDDDEGDGWSYDPAEHAFDAREHRSSGLRASRRHSLRDITSRLALPS